MAPKAAKSASTPVKKTTKKAIDEKPVKKTPQKRQHESDDEHNGSPSKPNPKRPKIDPFTLTLPSLGSLPTGVQVKYQTSISSSIDKAGGSELTIKLVAAGNFSLIGSYTAAEGEHKGCQVILIKPPKTFEFMSERFPAELRFRVYQHYFDYEGNHNEPIAVDTKRKAGGQYFARGYSGGSKNRVALLATCKQIYNEASPILYAKSLKFPDTTVMLSFLSELDDDRKAALRQLTIKQYKGQSNRAAFQNLKPAKCITKIHIENGVATINEVNKAADAFYNEISPFLDAITQQLKLKDADATKTDALKVFDLGEDAMHTKEGRYDEKQRAEFYEALAKKAADLPRLRWACVCGSTVAGHSCHQVLSAKHMIS